jgi:hypothetical protein
MNRRILSVMFLVIAVAACRQDRQVFRGNGQLAHVAGGLTLSGERDGVWVYFDDDGSIVYDELIGGVSYMRTGVYRNGQRIGSPTEAELEDAVETARRIMDQRSR